MLDLHRQILKTQRQMDTSILTAFFAPMRLGTSSTLTYADTIHFKEYNELMYLHSTG